MHTSLKTAYVRSDFRVSLNARISRGNQYPRVSQSLLHPCLPPGLIDHLVPAFPALSGTWICPLTYTSRCCTFFDCALRYPFVPPRGVVRCGAERSGAAIRLWWMWFREGRERSNMVACFLLWFFQPFYYPSSPYQTQPLLPTTTFSSINFQRVNPPLLRFPGSYISPKSTHNYKTFNLNVKLKRNGFSSASTVTIKNSFILFIRCIHPSERR